MTTQTHEPVRLTEVKTAMMLYMPFFATLLFDMMTLRVGRFPEIFGNLKPTAATDGKNIWIDEDFLATLTLPKAVFLVCHEIGHAMWMHMARAVNYKAIGIDGKPFDPRLWNIACDYIINDMLVQSKVGEMPPGGYHDPKRFPFDMLSDDVYRELMKNPPQGGGSGGQDENGNDGTTLDTHVHTSSPRTEAEWRQAVAGAADAAKAAGRLPGALERFATALLTPQVTWQERLKTALVNCISRDELTYRRMNRKRFILQKIILPATTGFGAGEVACVYDTSGSIGQQEIDHANSETAEILETCRPERVWILGCDAAVQSVEELYAGHDISQHPPMVRGGGGTDFNPPFDWARENDVALDALVYFTDGYGPFPKEPPPYPVIWCMTTDVTPPWGECIRIDLSKR